MSGFEVIGVVLALIPLVAGGNNRYKRVRDGQESRQLERSFRTQRVIFLNTIEDLIYPLVSDSQLQALLKDPTGRLWQDKQISASLEKLLDKVYPVFKDTIEDIKVIMTELQNALNAESLECRKVHRRIKLFLTRLRSEAGLERLRAKNADLEMLEGQSQRLASHRRVKSVKRESFGRVQERALSLYDALSRGWKCECQDAHLASLRLETRRFVAPPGGEGVEEEEEDIRFKFLFSFFAPSADQNTGAGSLD